MAGSYPPTSGRPLPSTEVGDRCPPARPAAGVCPQRARAVAFPDGQVTLGATMDRRGADSSARRGDVAWARPRVAELAGRSLIATVVALLAVLVVQAPAFADSATVKIPEGEGLHCAANGTATRVSVGVRTKDAV